MADADELLKVWASMAPPEGETWSLARPGPALDAVAARLSSVPRSFLDDDVSIRALSGDIAGAECASAAYADDARVRRGAAIGLWLLASEEIVEPFRPTLAGPWALRAVDSLGLRVAPVVDPLDWLADDERREEAARTFLLWAGFVPAGEDPRDRASALAGARLAPAQQRARRGLRRVRAPRRDRAAARRGPGEGGGGEVLQ
ncbi:hypothetical protein QE406_002179 [Microbacterium testaceum]|uniref:phosphohydrolase n=1 Tax=Microbacterium testaceum TaxID=2033 RepID=UPI0027830354|nr:phosphohydrolase [Microbacterium testaceum]MDQ1116170.1 hypothetical protein [Microbacterium testaceum]